MSTMFPKRIFAISAAFAIGFGLSTPASADNDFDVAVSKGKVTVTAHAGWHINKDYPWKLVVGDAKLDKSKFSLAETTATVTGAPKGTGTLKGAVCSADQCHQFQKDVNID